jgi:hypothetical protein
MTRRPHIIGAAQDCGGCVDEFGGPVQPEHDLLAAVDDEPLAYGPGPDEVSVADGLLLGDVGPELTGAIFALGYAVDETNARYWLAQCARRGADQTLLDRLWSTWADMNAPTLLHSTPTPREDTDR